MKIKIFLVLIVINISLVSSLLASEGLPPGVVISKKMVLHKSQRDGCGYCSTHRYSNTTKRASMVLCELENGACPSYNRCIGNDLRKKEGRNILKIKCSTKAKVVNNNSKCTYSGITCNTGYFAGPEEGYKWLKTDDEKCEQEIGNDKSCPSLLECLSRKKL